jgi:predicted Rossmann-fold nucleotide-binding protein
VQTHKTVKRLPIILYSSRYWNEVLNFGALVRWGTIGADDLKLFRIVDTPEEAFQHLKTELTRLYLEPEAIGGGA